MTSDHLKKNRSSIILCGQNPSASQPNFSLIFNVCILISCGKVEPLEYCRSFPSKNSSWKSEIIYRHRIFRSSFPNNL